MIPLPLWPTCILAMWPILNCSQMTFSHGSLLLTLMGWGTWLDDIEKIQALNRWIQSCSKGRWRRREEGDMDSKIWRVLPSIWMPCPCSLMWDNKYWDFLSVIVYKMMITHPLQTVLPQKIYFWYGITGAMATYEMLYSPSLRIWLAAVVKC